MNNKKTDILIIGAGLTGLTIAYLLKEENINIKIVESRNRLGGRIFSKISNEFTTIDLGATWIQKNHTRLLKLLKRLDVNIFKQKIGNTAIYQAEANLPIQQVKLPINENPSFRIIGGSSTLINSLAKNLNKDQILLNEKVYKINFLKNKVQLHTNKNVLESNIVISTIPPYLFANTIQLSSNLPMSIIEVMNKTHTWMGESIKVGLVYKKPFWLNNNFTGTVFSNVGPIFEFYDHSNFQDSKFAIKGFVKNELASVSKKERFDMILNQLRRIYGKQIDNYLSYEEMVWKNEIDTSFPYYKYISPHQNNGNPAFQNQFFNHKLIIAGSETAINFGGYMEGAIISAEFVSNQIINQIS